MLPKRCRMLSFIFRKPAISRHFGLSATIPTRSLEARLKHICLGNMLRAILALYILHRIGAIRFIVAMMLP